MAVSQMGPETRTPEPQTPALHSTATSRRRFDNNTSYLSTGAGRNRFSKNRFGLPLWDRIEIYH